MKDKENVEKCLKWIEERLDYIVQNLSEEELKEEDNKRAFESLKFAKNCIEQQCEYITMQELQAINLKCKELGWIE